MKKLLLVVASLLLFAVSNAHAAAFVSGSTGADGTFSPTANTMVTLPASGVFNYTTVNIPSGVTVTFKKNGANTPVYILATGDVTIAGTVKVDGASTVTSNPVSTAPGVGGPGGYDGGYGGASTMFGGKGMGPGGGAGGLNSSYYMGGGGGFGTAGGSNGSSYAAGGPTYGSARLIPLIGGSGGGGQAGSATISGYGGGGGGGAILIASSTTITITGSITANGGDTITVSSSYGGGGSGGAIRLIANTIAGTGLISAKGGTLNYNYRGGQGRIRLEANINAYAPGTDPPYTFGLPGSVFPVNVPNLTITGIAGASVPATPTGSYTTPDVILPDTTTNPVAVNISAQNIPVGTTVAVTVAPQFGGVSSVNAILSGSDASSTASASVNLSTQYANVVTAQATFTLLVAMYYDDERIDKVKVAAIMGKGSEVVYITETGREIPASEVLRKAM